MRKEYNVRIRLPQALGDEIHRLGLKENRSQSATVSWLVTRQLEAMRSATASTQRLVQILRGEADADAAQCQAHPADPLGRAVVAFVEAMRARWNCALSKTATRVPKYFCRANSCTIRP